MNSTADSGSDKRKQAARLKPKPKTKPFLGAGGIDPITQKRISDGCWNGGHVGSKSENRCVGYLASGAACECYCHTKKQSKQGDTAAQQQPEQPTLLDNTGDGIDIK